MEKNYVFFFFLDAIYNIRYGFKKKFLTTLR